MSETDKEVKVAEPKQKIQVDLEVDTSIKDLGVNTKIKTHQDDGKPQKTPLELALEHSFFKNFYWGLHPIHLDNAYFNQFAADSRQKETMVILYGFCNIPPPVATVTAVISVEYTQWLEQILLDWMHLKGYGLDKQPSWAIKDM